MLPSSRKAYKRYVTERCSMQSDITEFSMELEDLKEGYINFSTFFFKRWQNNEIEDKGRMKKGFTRYAFQEHMMHWIHTSNWYKFSEVTSMCSLSVSLCSQAMRISKSKNWQPSQFIIQCLRYSESVIKYKMTSV